MTLNARWLAAHSFIMMLIGGISVCAGFVPAFEKIGKNCHVYLTRDHVILLHNVLNSDGVQAIAQLAKVHITQFALEGLDVTHRLNDLSVRAVSVISDEKLKLACLLFRNCISALLRHPQG